MHTVCSMHTKYVGLIRISVYVVMLKSYVEYGGFFRFVLSRKVIFGNPVAVVKVFLLYSSDEYCIISFM